MKKFFAALNLIWLATALLLPVSPVFAGSCLCKGKIFVCVPGPGGDKRCSVQGEVDKCVKTLPDNKQIFSDQDCATLHDANYPNDPAIKCSYFGTDECGEPAKVIACGQDSKSVCNKSEKHCAAVADCVPDKNNIIGNVECQKSFCYYDARAKEAYDKSASSTFGIDTSLTIKKPIISIRIPGLTFSDVNDNIDSAGYIHVPYLGEYIAALYKFGVVVASLIAVAMVIKKGFDIAISPGGEAKTEAFQRIGAIVMGLLLVWGSYFILYSINPSLVGFKVLKVKYVEPEEISDREGGAEDAPAPHPSGPRAKGKGDGSVANRTACPDLKPGTKFTGAFTIYYSISKNSYGQPGEYKGAYKGGVAGISQDMGDFLCGVSMECGCPSATGKSSLRVCKNTAGTDWPICIPFVKDVPFCNAKNYVAGVTVAASTCFPRECKIKTGGRVLIVRDRGSGIIGTHFDLYLGVRGGQDEIKDTAWLNPNEIEIVDCPERTAIGAKELNRMRKAYESYRPGVCNPPQNC
ncbi:MAG: hypothetical protein Q7K39_02330 [Candidatus Magasanikbacteria bacterium]|nr:hypothetical protein [Candidatus Magasanikbacteria bacterium]